MKTTNKQAFVQNKMFNFAKCPGKIIRCVFMRAWVRACAHNPV